MPCFCDLMCRSMATRITAPCLLRSAERILSLLGLFALVALFVNKFAIVPPCHHRLPLRLVSVAFCPKPCSALQKMFPLSHPP